jgi:hypothetical protein
MSAPLLLRGSLLALALTAGPGAALEPASTMISPEEVASETPPGPWQGRWAVHRDDPRILSRAGAELLRLEMLDDPASGEVWVSWQAARAVCEDPLAPPFEWVGAGGEAQTEVLSPQGLFLSISLSADPDDPHRLFLAAPASGSLGLWVGPDTQWPVRLQRVPNGAAP